MRDAVMWVFCSDASLLGHGFPRNKELQQHVGQEEPVRSLRLGMHAGLTFVGAGPGHEPGLNTKTHFLLTFNSSEHTCMVNQRDNPNLIRTTMFFG